MKYIRGEGERILDYGCGHDKIIKNAVGIDIRPCEGVDIVTNGINGVYDLSENVALRNWVENTSVVFSSHFLEHVKDDVRMVNSWIKMLKVGGYLILYLPDDNHYDNSANPEHLHRYTYSDFTDNFIAKFAELELIDGGSDVGDDRYSFYVVLQKKREIGI
jgi:trans-aconitate methyltransferase